jgi:hypothetical protein
MLNKISVASKSVLGVSYENICIIFCTDPLAVKFRHTRPSKNDGSSVDGCHQIFDQNKVVNMAYLSCCGIHILFNSAVTILPHASVSLMHMCIFVKQHLA